MITRDHIINDVIQRYPDTVEVFRRFSVDACCGGAHSIAMTASARGISDLTPLLQTLNRQTRKLHEKPLTHVIEEIETTHHVYLKEELPALQELAAGLAEEIKGEAAAEPASKLRKALSALADEINEHLFKEEHILFPTIRRLEAALGSEEPIDDVLLGCGTQGPIAQMHAEHDEAKGTLERIGEALEALEGTGPVAEATANLRPRLERLHDDLLEHIRAEEEDLFPRAASLENQALERVPQGRRE